MKLNRINEQLARLTSMVEGWQGDVRPSAIERDLALETLRHLYDEVLDLECGGVIKEALSDAQIPVAVVATVAAECEKTETSEEREDERENKVAVETIEESNEQAESVVEPSPAVDDTAMLIDIDALLGISRDDEQDTPLTETSVAVAVPNADVVESGSEPNEPNAVVEGEQSAEFDVNDLPKRRKSNRRMLSLYDDAATTYPSAEVASDSKVEAAIPTADVVADALAEEPIPAVEPIEEVAQPIEKTNPVEQILPEPISQPVEPKAQSTEPKVQSAETKAQPARQSQPQSVVIPAEPKAQRVAQPIQPATQPRLGDVLRENVTVLADAMFDDSQAVNAVTRISDLRKAIGLNDKFLMIRDLFDGNAQRYEDTITTLNEFNDLDECIIYISENFVWDPASEGAKLLMSLIERKLS